MFAELERHSKSAQWSKKDFSYILAPILHSLLSSEFPLLPGTSNNYKTDRFASHLNQPSN